MRHGVCVAAAVALVVGVSGTACGGPDSGTAPEATSPSSATVAVLDDSLLPSLVPTPANSQGTQGPDGIADNGIHLHFVVNGSPGDVMASYRAALQDKGWEVTTIVTSGGEGGGGATYTGTNGAAYGVFDGGGFNTTTYIDVCAWPTKPAEPNCTRGDR
ncbi:hypothetical protein ORI20_19180 [Mycobacterium sp. CVI_P3]|uniref:Lipoprotein LppJ n=1 Tax=Mycobacterium pinniadriaticum TaxID=2994102 RepID=A0ABT3SHY9_9MYCO|nr:hypothetical protein [Mycobacterium pinniadriaticum]MCX2932400.1 hypothetical protein [Mycobacterium pinniadriaticum]MCX2938743.1 hypothetical protein [Mycobacterium pinniadriaticum]